MSRTRIAVIGGGQNCEHEVSLASAAAVARALEPTYHVVRLTIDREGGWRDGADRPIGLPAAVTVLHTCAVSIPVLHGPRGEDGTVAALCELSGVPYLGSGVGAGSLAMNKWATKLVAGALGIATTAGILLTAAASKSYAFTGPVVVNPWPPGPAAASVWSEAPVSWRRPSKRPLPSTTGCSSRTLS